MCHYFAATCFGFGPSFQLYSGHLLITPPSQKLTMPKTHQSRGALGCACRSLGWCGLCFRTYLRSGFADCVGMVTISRVTWDQDHTMPPRHSKTSRSANGQKGLYLRNAKSRGELSASARSLGLGADPHHRLAAPLGEVHHAGQRVAGAAVAAVTGDGGLTRLTLAGLATCSSHFVPIVMEGQALRPWGCL